MSAVAVPARRADEEREVILGLAGADTGGVDAARQIGDAQLEIWRPAGVAQIVVVEVDRAVLARARCLQSCAAPVQRCPVTPRIGMLTACPWCS